MPESIFRAKPMT